MLSENAEPHDLKATMRRDEEGYLDWATSGFGGSPMRLVVMHDGGPELCQNCEHEADDVVSYVKLADAVSRLRAWVLETVHPRYHRSCLKPEDSIKTWVARLDEQNGHKSVWGKSESLKRYRRATKRLVVKPGADEFRTWTRDWHTAMALGEMSEIAPCIDPHQWFPDFLHAIGAVEPVTMEVLNNVWHEDVMQGKKTYSDVHGRFYKSLLLDWD